MLTITIWYSSKNRTGTSLEERKIKNSIQEGLAPRRSRRDLWIFGEAGAAATSSYPVHKHVATHHQVLYCDCIHTCTYICICACICECIHICICMSNWIRERQRCRGLTFSYPTRVPAHHQTLHCISLLLIPHCTVCTEYAAFQLFTSVTVCPML